MSRKVSGSAEGRIRPKPCGGFGCQFSERGCQVSGVGFQEKPLNLKPGNYFLGN